MARKSKHSRTTVEEPEILVPLGKQVKARTLNKGSRVILNDGTIASVRDVTVQKYETITEHDVRIVTYSTSEDGPVYVMPILGSEEIEVADDMDEKPIRTISLWSYLMMLFGFRTPDTRTITYGEGTTYSTRKAVTNDKP